MTSQAVVAKKQHQPTQAVDNPSAGKDQPSTSSPPPTDDGKNAPTVNERIDIFIHGKKHHSSNPHSNSATPSTKPTYITGTLVDCNVVFATPNYFSQLAIDSCNQQYRK